MSRIGIERTGNVVTNAFHGTSMHNARKILAEGFEVRRKRDLILGDGIYFYQGSPSEAKRFAVEVRKYKQVVVLRSRIDMGRCLDLDSQEHRDVLELIEEELLEKRTYANLTLAGAINYLAKITQVDCVKTTIELERNLVHFRKEPAFSRTRTTIAVRNVAIISDTIEEPIS